MADEDMEAARVVMRRFMWMLNDESGGIGWGVPEAMGEVVASHGRLGKEFANILVSYVCVDRNYLEYEPLQRGALWAIGRVAEAKKELVKEAGPCVVQNLWSLDAPIRGLAVWVVGLLGLTDVEAESESLLADDREIPLFVNEELTFPTVSSLAQEALSRIGPRF